MKQEDIWGSLDDRWKGASRGRWRKSKKALVRTLAVVLLLQLLGAGYVETGFSERTSTLIDEAVRDCRDMATSLSEQNCAPLLWRACHAEYPSFRIEPENAVSPSWAANRLCEIAKIAEVAELVFVLASKYGDSYFLEEHSLYDPPEPPYHEFYCLQHAIDRMLFWFFPRNPTVHEDIYPSPPYAPFCLGSVQNFFGVQRDLTSPESRTLERLTHIVFPLFDNYEPARTRPRSEERLSLPTMPTTDISITVPVPAWTPEQTELACYAARNSLREKLPEAQMDADQCLMSAAQTCQDATDIAKQHCASAANEVKIEQLWQRLPVTCAQADDISDDSFDDSCRQAANRICATPYTEPNPHIFRSPRSLYLIREFSCSLSQQPPPPPEERDILPIANEDEILGGLDSWIWIDVLANDADVEGDFDLFTLTIVESKRPRKGIARVFLTPQRLPIIEYRQISVFVDKNNTFSYQICDDLNRCDSAQVTVVYPDCTITGTSGNDSLVGTSGDDVICGLGGDDIINGKAGNDLIHAGQGADIIYSGTGDDTMFGGPGNDLIFGHRGHDTIYGGPGDDRLYGGEGDDAIYGGEEPDEIHGGYGNDTLYGGYGNDTIRGGEGADTIYPSMFVDTILDPSEEDVIF